MGTVGEGSVVFVTNMSVENESYTTEGDNGPDYEIFHIYEMKS